MGPLASVCSSAWPARPELICSGAAAAPPVAFRFISGAAAAGPPVVFRFCAAALALSSRCASALSSSCAAARFPAARDWPMGNLGGISLAFGGGFDARFVAQEANRPRAYRIPDADDERKRIAQRARGLVYWLRSTRHCRSRTRRRRGSFSSGPSKKISTVPVAPVASIVQM